MKAIEAAGLPHLIFINKIDTLAGQVREIVAALQPYSQYPLVLRQIPIREHDSVTGYVDVVSERAYHYCGEDSERVALPKELRAPEQEALAGLTEVLADHDDALLEKVIEDIAPSPDEIFATLHKDQASGTIVQVLFGAAVVNPGGAGVGPDVDDKRLRPHPGAKYLDRAGLESILVDLVRRLEDPAAQARIETPWLAR